MDARTKSEKEKWDDYAQMTKDICEVLDQEKEPGGGFAGWQEYTATSLSSIIARHLIAEKGWTRGGGE